MIICGAIWGCGNSSNFGNFYEKDNLKSKFLTRCRAFRLILVDFRTNSEKLFHCGASSKDAGNKITTIVQLDDIDAYRNMFEELYDRQKQKNTRLTI